MHTIQLITINDALANMHKLNEWEKSFINGLAAKPVRYQCSAKETDKLGKIYAKINGTPSYNKPFGEKST